MATLVKIKNLSRRRLRFGSGTTAVSLAAAFPTGTGAVATIDIDDSLTRRDLYRNLGSYAFASDVLVAKVALAAGIVGGGTCFAWANPEGAAILVHNLLVDITTQSSAGTAVLNAGVAANGTTSNAGLIASGALNAVAVLNSAGKAQHAGTTDFVTGSVATATATALAGFAYIFYTLV